MKKLSTLMTLRIPSISSLSRIWSPIIPRYTKSTGLRLLSSFCPSQSSSEDLLQRSLIHRPIRTPPNDSHLRSSVIDKDGHIELLSVDVTKKDLMVRYKLMPRDIRKLNYQPTLETSVVPYISVRNDLILVDILNIRALIRADCVILFDLSMTSFEKHQVLRSLQEKLEKKPGELPYELKALETILLLVSQDLSQEVKVHQNLMKLLLSELEGHIHTANLKLLLNQNKKVTGFYQKARLVRDVVDDLLQQDDQLTAMYLSAPRNVITDHTEVEILLETYYRHFDETVQAAEEIINNIRTTQEIINIVLDANRNQLMLLGLRFSIGILFLGCGIYVASIYGMNLENFIEEDDYGFILVVGLTSVIILNFFFRSLHRLKSLEKIAISGKELMPLKHKRHKDLFL